MKKSTQVEVKKRLAKYGLFKTLPPSSLEIENEEKLWRGVIDRLLADIIEPIDLIHFSEALEWFTLDNPDFIIVCELSSLEPSWVLKTLNLLREMNDRELEK